MNAVYKEFFSAALSEPRDGGREGADGSDNARRNRRACQSGVSCRRPGPGVPRVTESPARRSRRRQRPRGAIELRGVTKRYGAERVVDRRDPRHPPGEFFSLLGPSGSGKTTTLMMIAGFASGRRRRDRRSTGATSPASRRRSRGFGMVFQNYAIFPHLNVFENVAFPLAGARLADGADPRARGAGRSALVRLERFGDRFCTPALRRPAAACRHRARHRLRPAASC